MGSETKSPGLKIDDVPRFEAVVKGIEKAWRDVERGKYRLRDLALATFITFTGCRLGEALQVKVLDFDPQNRVVRIHQEKKGRDFIRIVPIPSRLFWKIMLRYLSRFPFKDEKIFNISDRQARNIIYKFTKRYLGRKIRPHALRHSYAMYMLRKLGNLEYVRRLLGHSDYKWLRIYLDHTQEDLEDKLEEVFEEIE